MNIARIEDYVKLYEKRKAIEADLKQIKEEEDVAESLAQDELINAGVDAIKACGKSISITRKFHAGCSGPEAVDGLLASGLKDCIMVGFMRMNAFVKEFLEQDKEAHEGPEWTVAAAMDRFNAQYPAMTGHVAVQEKVGLSVRKG